MESPLSPASIKRLPGSSELLAIYNDYAAQGTRATYTLVAITAFRITEVTCTCTGNVDPFHRARDASTEASRHDPVS